ncbi:MAG: argininosuccinate lyase, partial [Candidatus Omnitrophota bacterium]
GSVANRGSTLPIDRFYVAKLLGFAKVSGNSIDSVSDRDFVIEILSDLAILSMHLSRIAEDFIIWSSDEFDFVEGDDSHYTGSSMMPNKKNPDPFELIRGYTGKIYGDLISVLVMMKGLPFIYNRDMQLDKPPLFESVEKIKKMLLILEKVLYGIKIEVNKMKSASQNEFIFAADVCEFLVTKKHPNRDAHDITGRLIRYSIEKNKEIKEMSDDELKKFAPELNKKLMKDLLNPIESVKRVKSYGGTSPKSVNNQIAYWERKLR